tara:strand:- start:395 stop:1099 length:705 start_codon:yes stop_codon:yes gene_type:complete
MSDQQEIPMEEFKNTMSGGGFINHVLNFDDSTKKHLMNSSQYLLTAITPVILLNKVLEDLLSDFDDSKGNFELLAEVILQFTSLITGMFFIHRVITYLPTYSGVPYENINLFSIILSMVFVLYYTQSKLGFKMKLLGERVGELWNGKEEVPVKKSKKEKKNNAPVTNTNLLAPAMPTNEASRADYLMSHDQMSDPTKNNINNIGPNDPYAQVDNQFYGIINDPMAANGVLNSTW